MKYEGRGVKFCWFWTYIYCLCELIIDFWWIKFWIIDYLLKISDSSHGYYLIPGIMLLKCRTKSNSSSIWLRVKPVVLLTVSIMTNAKYLKGISSSQHSSINELQSCKNELSSWYDFYSYVILVSMKLWTQPLALYIFCNMPYMQHLV